jgi:hypothetical protein
MDCGLKDGPTEGMKDGGIRTVGHMDTDMKERRYEGWTDGRMEVHIKDGGMKERQDRLTEV